MAWVILCLGLALCVSGAAAIWSGISYMPVEWGWSQIIAGATAMSGGVVTIGLAAVVHRLRALQNAMLGLVEPQAIADELAPEADDTADGYSDHLPEPAAERTPPGPPSRAILIAPPEAADEVAASSNGHGRRVGIGDVVGLVTPPPEADRPDIVSDSLPPEVIERDAEHAYAGDGAAVVAPAEAEVAERTVVGRYEAGGASYALFSDGTIEVETETGTHRFGSMDELKDFLERQDRAGQADWPE